MNYIYSFFSIIALVPLYFVNKKLTSSVYQVTAFWGIAISFLCILFHIIVLRAHVIPILNIPVPEDEEFMQYGPLIYAILCAVVCMLSHGKGLE